MAFYRRTRTRTPVKKKTTRKIYRPALPSRFNSSYKTYKKTKALSKSMTNYGETIYTALLQQNEVTPTTQVGSTKTFSLQYTLGANPPTGWTGYTALGGMAIPQGTGTNERIGQWAYLKKGHATISLRS